MSKTEFLRPNEPEFERAAALLRHGDVVAVPTETVYGLAALVRDTNAVLKIFQAKERPLFDPLIVHIPQSWLSSQNVLSRLEVEGMIDLKLFSDVAKTNANNLIQRFWPGPLTLVLPRGPRVPDLVTSGLDTVAIRVPRHSIVQRLLERLNEPIAAPSANRFGRISPTTAEHVLKELDGRIAAILDGGACEVGLESTILHLNADTGLALCLRPGGCTIEEIEKVMGSSVQTKSQVDKVEAPGMLESHYAPKTTLVIRDRSEIIEEAKSGFAKWNSQRVALLLLSPLKCEVEPGVVARTLSEDGDEAEVARNLFGALRELDEARCDVILAERCVNQNGLGYAITDRLSRAAAKGER